MAESCVLHPWITGIQALRQSKVSDLSNGLVDDYDVVASESSVDEVVTVQVGQGFGHVVADVDLHTVGERSQRLVQESC